MGRLAYHIATVLGLGDRLPAPGTTAGSLPAAIGWWLAAVLVEPPGARLAATLLGVVTVTAVGLWAAGVESRRRGGADPGPVVIDEVAGQWVALVPVPIVLVIQTPWRLAGAAAVGFLLFRFFDVAKPWPVRRLEALPGAVGIMADDLAAGALAGAVLALILAVG